MKAFQHAEDFKSTLANARQSNSELATTATVAEGLERWLKIHSIGNKPRTVDFNRELVKLIQSHWPDLQTPISQVTQDQSVTFASAIAHFCSSRYNGMVNAIRSFVPAARFIPRKKIRLADASSIIPTPEEFDRLLVALDCAQSGRSGLVIRFLAHTGFRINEARRLLWTDVKEDHIYARAEITKNGRPRTVPFIPGTREVLQALKKFSKNGNVLPQGLCHRALRYAARFTGLPQYGHHTFRHYFATRCIVSGVDIPTVAKWLGHLDNGVLLLRTYCHLVDEHSAAMALRVKLGAKFANPEAFVSLHATRATHSANIVQLSGAFFADAGKNAMPQGAQIGVAAVDTVTQGK